MPGGDGTGPYGYGPQTGRRGGYCAGYTVPLYGRRFGRGLGFGRGYGRGLGWGRGPAMRPYQRGPGFWPQLPDEEEAYLENAINSLEEELSALKSRLAQVEKEKSKE